MELVKQISSAAGAKSGVGAGGAGSMVCTPLQDHSGDGFYTTCHLGRKVLPGLWGAVGPDMGTAESDKDATVFVEVQAPQILGGNFEARE